MATVLLRSNMHLKAYPAFVMHAVVRKATKLRLAGPVQGRYFISSETLHSQLQAHDAIL